MASLFHGLRSNTKKLCCLVEILAHGRGRYLDTCIQTIIQMELPQSVGVYTVGPI